MNIQKSRHSVQALEGGGDGGLNYFNQKPQALQAKFITTRFFTAYKKLLLRGYSHGFFSKRFVQAQFKKHSILRGV